MRPRRAGRSATRDRPTTSTPRANRASATGPALAGRRVLVVEDDPIIRRMMGQILTQAGAHVREADGVRSALELLKSGASFDVLCTDGILGDGTARTVIEDFSSRHPAAAS